MNWIDISVGLQSPMPHWPGDPAPTMNRTVDMDSGGVCNVRYLTMSAHTGTHMDAPLHFIRDGGSIDTMPLTATVGPARVIAIEHSEFITPDELSRHDIKPNERLLFKTRNSAGIWKSTEFVKQFVHCNAAAAAYLVERQVQTIGIDYLSIGAFERDGVETHQILLGAGIWVIEGLNFENVEPGSYDLVCLPLKLIGGDGAPARAIVRKAER